MKLEMTIKIINLIGTIFSVLEIIISYSINTSLLISEENNNFSKEKERGIENNGSIKTDNVFSNNSVNIDKAIVIKNINITFNYNKK